MIKLNNEQKAKLIDTLYSPEEEPQISKALHNAFFNGASLYESERKYKLSPNTLAHKARRIKKQIKLIEDVLNVS